MPGGWGGGGGGGEGGATCLNSLSVTHSWCPGLFIVIVNHYNISLGFQLLPHKLLIYRPIPAINVYSPLCAVFSQVVYNHADTCPRRLEGVG